jgi:hypothetical protein
MLCCIYKCIFLTTRNNNVQKKKIEASTLTAWSMVCTIFYGSETWIGGSKIPLTTRMYAISWFVFNVVRSLFAIITVVKGVKGQTSPKTIQHLETKDRMTLGNRRKIAL